MRVTTYLPMMLLPIVMVLVDSKYDLGDDSENDDHEHKTEDQGSARIFPLLPPYQGVDFAANFNKLKSSGDAGYFVVRDSIVFLGVNLMWIVVHSLIWDGKVSNLQDITASILSPGQEVALSNPTRKSSASPSSRFSVDSLSELSFVKLWNFFTDPNPSTRNLFLNIGFAVGGHILWILPTFLGTLPDQEERGEDRLGGLPSNLAGADPIALWNRLLCPQCILQIVGINSINYFGKLLFWTFMSSVPDVPAATVVGRAMDSPAEMTMVGMVVKEMQENVREMMDTRGWWD